MGYEIVRGFPSTSNNDYQLNVPTILRHAARSYGEVEIASRNLDGSVFRYDYRGCYRRVCRLANALRKLGVGPGDRVGVLDFNTHRFAELFYAISGLGAVLLQINPRVSTEDRAYIINHSGARLICVSDLLIPLIEPISQQLNTVEGYLVITDRAADSLQTQLQPLYAYEELLQGEGEDIQWPMVDEKAACSACYTTGTTGKPKGVYVSHRALYLHTLAVAINLNLTRHDVMMQITPMFHVLGWGAFITAPLVGAKLVFPGMYTLEMANVLVDMLLAEKVTVTCGAPAIFMPMLEYIRKMDPKPDLKGCRMVSGASEPPLAMMKEYWELGKADVIHAYGATETTPLVSINFLKDSLQDLSEEERWDLKRKQGIPVVGIDVKLVDEEGNELPFDGKSVGELYIRGPWVTCSYHEDPRSAEAFTEDGYWKSGDAAVIDPNCYIKIVDRFKDLVKSGGEWISTVDLENAIMAHPAVLEAGVIGIPHPEWEERPLALVVLREEHKGKVSKEDILDFIAPKFAKWQLPDEILFVEEIPKTSVGKIAKRVAREQFGDFYMKK
ncbi:long-chain fatty acid--CoA ligase [Candidatus Solincola tengchongensis]|uniref:long-chain fatty acid--CoA ligase n=1 Tax=Candidatus Solincola tengchongensis TaxID=2900693 RepID=UPI00257E9BAB|nr:long-chain fatty acid--CoA ligase [Candidatus Solincola tengchongensis]